MSNVKTVSVMKNVKNPSYDSILFTFASFAQEIGRVPTVDQLPDLDFQFVIAGTQKVQKAPITKAVVEKHFGSLDRLKAAARQVYPEMFDHVVDSKFYMPKKMESLTQSLGLGSKGKKVKTVIVTSANADSPINKKALDGLMTAARFYNAEIIVIPTNGDLEKMPRSLVENKKVHILYRDVRLNNAIALSPTVINPKKGNPVSGMNLLVRRNNCSIVFGSPKVMLEPVPCAAPRLPDNLIATGSISYPRYTKEESEKLLAGNQLAEFYHQYGAFVIELDGENRYHARNLNIEGSTGKVRDFAWSFLPDGSVLPETPDTSVYGDLHSSLKDQVAFNAALGLSKVLKTPNGVVHDAFEASHGTSSHLYGKIAENTAKAISGMSNTGEEISILARDFETLTTIHKKLSVVDSNHNDMLSRSAEGGQILTQDPNNNIYGWVVAPYLTAYHMIHTCKVKNPAKKMAEYMQIDEAELLRRYPKIDKGITPLEALIDLKNLKNRENIKFIAMDGDLKVGRTDLSKHGDRGSNGAKFSMATGKATLGSFVFGHTHKSAINGYGVNVGTMSQLQMGYNRGGFSSWSHSMASVYKDGSVQLVIITDGSYTNFDIQKMMNKIGKGIKV
jgi:hypothetical protein